jgi:type VI secretion system protein
VFERSLLERIADPMPNGERKLTIDSSAFAESILRNLADLLNVRRGSVEASPDLGMPDFNDLALRFPEGINILSTEVSRQITLYEPRLAAVSVKHLPDPDNPLSLRLEVEASLRLPGDHRRIKFSTSVGDDGRWRFGI